MIVVSDTSPIINLATIGYLHLLPDLFTEIIIPTAVFNEVAGAGNDEPGAKEIRESSWVKVHAAPNQQLLPQLLHDLDPGEAEAIALAVNIKAEYVLMDEALGRKIAVSYQLQPLGILGILLLAKRRGMIQAVTPLMDRLRSEANFFVDARLYHYIKRLAEE
jgi:predicted nucleic acid-binding protein